MRVVMDGGYEAQFEKGTKEVLATVSENLRWRRQELGLKLWEVSAATGGMEIGSLSRLFNGHREFYPSTLVRLSVALGVEYADWHLPPAQFKKKYRGDERPFEVRIVPTAGSRSSLRSKAAKGRKSTTVTKGSPFRKPAPLPVAAPSRGAAAA